jgi:hypothetical protein
MLCTTSNGDKLANNSILVSTEADSEQKVRLILTGSWRFDEFIYNIIWKMTSQVSVMSRYHVKTGMTQMLASGH